MFDDLNLDDGDLEVILVLAIISQIPCAGNGLQWPLDEPVSKIITNVSLVNITFFIVVIKITIIVIK